VRVFENTNEDVIGKFFQKTYLLAKRCRAAVLYLTLTNSLSGAPVSYSFGKTKLLPLGKMIEQA
jgi:hypothetical protein